MWQVCSLEVVYIYICDKAHVDISVTLRKGPKHWWTYFALFFLHITFMRYIMESQ